MKASSRSHHQGYGNLGPASGGYLPPMSTAERRREKGRRGVKVCCVLDRQWGEGAVQESYFIGFKSAWQFLEAGAGWDSDYSSSSSNTTHPASHPSFSPTLLQQVDVSLPSFCHWSPSPYMPWLQDEQHYGLLWRTGGTYPNESFSPLWSAQESGFHKSEYEWIYLSVDLMDWRLDYLHILSHIYVQSEISEGENGAISVNELCIEIFIKYLLWFITHSKKLECLFWIIS